MRMVIVYDDPVEIEHNRAQARCDGRQIKILVSRDHTVAESVPRGKQSLLVQGYRLGYAAGRPLRTCTQIYPIA